MVNVGCPSVTIKTLESADQVQMLLWRHNLVKSESFKWNRNSIASFDFDPAFGSPRLWCPPWSCGFARQAHMSLDLLIQRFHHRGVILTQLQSSWCCFVTIKFRVMATPLVGTNSRLWCVTSSVSRLYQDSWVMSTQAGIDLVQFLVRIIIIGTQHTVVTATQESRNFWITPPARIDTPSFPVRRWPWPISVELPSSHESRLLKPRAR